MWQMLGFASASAVERLVLQSYWNRVYQLRSCKVKCAIVNRIVGGGKWGVARWWVVDLPGGQMILAHSKPWDCNYVTGEEYSSQV